MAGGCSAGLPVWQVAAARASFLAEMRAEIEKAQHRAVMEQQAQQAQQAAVQAQAQVTSSEKQ